MRKIGYQTFGPSSHVFCNFGCGEGLWPCILLDDVTSGFFFCRAGVEIWGRSILSTSRIPFMVTRFCPIFHRSFVS